jgi:tetratricopeptide (TPR) repeat protein
VLAGLTAALVLALVAGSSGVLYQWRLAVAARFDAETSDAQAQQLLGELLQSNPVYPLQFDYYHPAPTTERLLKAESHCEKFLQNRPGDTGLRSALTRVRGGLATQLLVRGQVAEADACLQSARDLWEPLARQDPHNPEYRGWLATTHCWQGYAAQIQGDYARSLESCQQAYALWQELAEERPGDGALGQQVADCRWNMIDLTAITSARAEILRPLEKDRALLGHLVCEDPSNTALRKRLAFTCLLLGELHHQDRSETKAVPCWQQAYEHYVMLATEPREDFLVPLSLGLCCSRLMGDQPADPYYLEAVARYEQAGPLLAALVKQHPESNSLRRALLEDYCSLALCHRKAGQTARAEQVIADQVRPLATTPGSGYSFEPRCDAGLLGTLIHLASALRDAKQPDAALPLAREAALLADRYAASPWSDLLFTDWLEVESLSLAVILRQLGEPAESLRQAEQARRLSEELCHAAPDHLMNGVRLSDAWQQIGKARWELGQAQEALAAFRESAVVQGQVFERAPSIRAHRIALSRCYDRLALWGGRCGKRAEVAAALLEREKLWPDEPAELRKVALDFEKLAKEVAGGRDLLSPEEQRERQGYLDQSERTKRAAEGVARRAGGIPQGATAEPPR